MAIVIVGMLDEREEALRTIKEQIERRGHRTVLIDIGVGTGAVVPALKADVSSREMVELARGAGSSATGRKETAASLMAEGLTKKSAPSTSRASLRGSLP